MINEVNDIQRILLFDMNGGGIFGLEVGMDLQSGVYVVQIFSGDVVEQK